MISLEWSVVSKRGLSVQYPPAYEFAHFAINMLAFKSLN